MQFKSENFLKSQLFLAILVAAINTLVPNVKTIVQSKQPPIDVICSSLLTLAATAAAIQSAISNNSIYFTPDNLPGRNKSDIDSNPNVQIINEDDF